MDSAAISAQAMSKLRWRCRRGLLENDLLIERFFRSRVGLGQSDANGLYALMQLDDHSLLDLFLGRREPEGHLDRTDVRQVLDAIRPHPSARIAA